LSNQTVLLVVNRNVSDIYVGLILLLKEGVLRMAVTGPAIVAAYADFAACAVGFE
jgi:hypothetical protein